MNRIIEEIRIELEKNADEYTKKNFQRFFKENVKYYGVKTGIVDKIARQFWLKIKDLDKPEIFRMCEELYLSDFSEEAFIAAIWVPKLTHLFEQKDLEIFKNWIEKYINNWAKCDSFCNHTIGNFLEKFPQSIEEIKTWTGSPNRWLKRAAAVSLILPARQGGFLKDIFDIADSLLLDKDDMVQKGYGWMLKEASKRHQAEVLEYILKHKANMPRTALRYAIELMPKELKAEAMKR